VFLSLIPRKTTFSLADKPWNQSLMSTFGLSGEEMVFRSLSGDTTATATPAFFPPSMFSGSAMMMFLNNNPAYDDDDELLLLL
jgi:hypothetical protein